MKRVFFCLLAVCLLLGLCAFGVAAEGKAAVMVTDITWDGANQPKPGAKVVFSAHLKNNGTAAATKAVSVALYVNSEKKFTQTYDKGIAAGQTVQVKFPKWEAVAGEHAVTVVLDECKPDRKNWTQKQHLTANIRVADKALELPAVAEKFGMTELVFSDDFTTLGTIDVDASKGYGYKWYPTRPYGATTLLPTDYELTKDGILLKEEKSTYNYGLCTLDCSTGAGWSYAHGYMEIRLRVAPNRQIEGTTGSPAVWSLPPEKLMSFSDKNHWVETDFMEYWGDNSFSTTLHDQHFVDANGKEYIHWYKSSNHEQQGLGDGDWHTMGFVRRNHSLVSYLDGKEYVAVYWDEDKRSYPEATLQNLGDGVGAFSLADSQLLPLIISGAKGWPMEVDYVRVWEGNKEANQGESIEAAQFMDMYLRDGDGQIELTVNFENYEAFIDVEEEFLELGATQQEELNRLAKREVGKTMAQVIGDAKQFKADMEAFVAAFAVDSEGALLDTESVDACKVIVKGERKWNKMSAELKEAVNNYVYLNNGVMYEELLAAAREKVPASPIKPWMIVVVVAVIAVGVAVAIPCKKCCKKTKEE